MCSELENSFWPTDLKEQFHHIQVAILHSQIQRPVASAALWKEKNRQK